MSGLQFSKCLRETSCLTNLNGRSTYPKLEIKIPASCVPAAFPTSGWPLSQPDAAIISSAIIIIII